MKIVILLILAISAITQAAYLRFVHASPDTPNVDVYLNNAIVPSMTNLQFGNVTQYAYFGSLGNFHIQVFPAGQMNPVLVDATATWNTLTEPWTLFLVDYAKSLSNILEKDGLGIIKDGRAAVRLVHLSPDAPAVDLKLNGNMTVFTNVSYKTLTMYQELDVDSYSFQIYPTGTDTPVVTIDAQLYGWTLYSVIVLGTVSGDQPLQVVVRIDV